MATEEDIDQIEGSAAFSDDDDSVELVIPPIKKRKYKSKKADDVEKQIQEILHSLYNDKAKADARFAFKFNEAINSTSNEEVKTLWRKLLLKKRPDKYKDEDWSEKRLNGRLSRLFWSKKYISKKTPLEKAAKNTSDRRCSRLKEKRDRRLKALGRLVAKREISKKDAKDVLVHLEYPSDEESDIEGSGKVVKVAIAEHRSEKLKNCYKLLDEERSSAKRGGQSSGAQRLPRIPWTGSSHPTPLGAAAWTLQE